MTLKFPWYGKMFELTKLFHDEFELCKIKEGTKVAIVTDPKNDPSYADAAFTALYHLGADFFEAIVPHTKVEFMGPSGALLEGLKKADFVVDLTCDPWQKSKANIEIRKAGGRILRVMSCALQPEDTLRVLFPTADHIRRTNNGAKMIERAKTVRVTSQSGTDLTCDKSGRSGHGQDGIADKPGEWDNFPSGLVACMPLEDATNGTLVINVGEPYFAAGASPLNIVCSSQVKMEWKEGRITKIEGSLDAKILEEWLASFNNEESYGLSHIGFGTHPGARWSANSIMEWESYNGNVLVGVGRNYPDGKNMAPSHLDIALKNINWYHDDELIIRNGKFVHSDLK